MRDGQLGRRGGVRAPGKKRNRLGMNSVWRESSKAFFPGGCGFTSVSRTSCGLGGGGGPEDEQDKTQTDEMDSGDNGDCMSSHEDLRRFTTE